VLVSFLAVFTDSPITADVDDPDDRSTHAHLARTSSTSAALNAEGVRYVLISGFAVILHGFVRATKDMNLLVDAAEHRLKRAMA
jgi:hypothetical protein